MTSDALPSPVLRLRARRPAAVDLRALPAWRLTVAMFALAGVLGLTLGFGYDGTDLNLVAGCAVFALTVAILLRRAGADRVAAGIEGMVLILGATIATAILSALFATSALPLRDAALARADAALFGTGWPAVARWMEGRSQLSAWLVGAYATLAWQPFALVAALAVAGRIEALWRFVRAWAGALAVCVAIFPLVPAIGPFVFFGHDPASNPLLTDASPGWRAPQVLTALRDGTLTTIDASRLTGLVAFPSFHTAGAILLIWGWTRLPRAIGTPFVPLNLMMIAATPTVGSHYLVDTLAGAVLAIAVIRWSRSA